MSKLKLDLDIDLVQATVRDQVKPAVAEALAKHDVKALIVKALEAPTMPENYGYYMPMFLGREKKSEPLIDGLVRDAVYEAAKAYVAKAMKENRAAVEEAFSKMMRDSSSKLAQSFAKAITSGITSNDWGFRLDVNVKHTVPARDPEYDD